MLVRARLLQSKLTAQSAKRFHRRFLSDAKAQPKAPAQPERPVLREAAQFNKVNPTMQKIGTGIFLGAVGALLVLGTWQIERRRQKFEKIEERLKGLDAAPQALETLVDSSLEDLMHRQVTAKGHFDYSRQVYHGPRSCPDQSDPVMSHTAGHFLITPLVLAGGKEVLVNRGWVKKVEWADGATVPEDTEGREVEVRGVLTVGESRNKYMLNWQPSGDMKEWLVLVTAEIQEIVKLKPLVGSGAMVLEAIEVGGSNSTNGLKGFIRKNKEQYVDFYTSPNTHILYAATWYTLAGFLSLVTWTRFKKMKKLGRV
jgi:cytochrome oxidase assembly protein ShyY1